MLRRGLLAILFCGVWCGAALAQSPPADPPPAVPPAPSALTNDAILQMVKDGFSEDLLVKAIRTMETRFDLSPEALREMKKAGVSEAILRAMLAPKDLDPAPKAVEKKPADVPDDIGVYLLKDGELREVLPELVTWRSGGVAKSMLLGTKGHINGVVKGPHSTLKLGPPVEFVIRLPESVDIVEYQLLRLDMKDDRREFRALTGGYFHSSGGSEKNAVEFKWKKIAPRTYRIALDRLPKGEYGFLGPGGDYGAIGGGMSGAPIMQGRATVGKMYTFHVVE